MSQPNYEILGMRLSYDMRENIEAIVNQFDPALLQNIAPNDSKEVACRIHLGYSPPSPKTRKILEEGAGWCVEHFQRGDTRDVVGGWFDPLFYGMVLCLLTKDTAKLRSICSWAKPTKRPEYKGPLEDEVQLLYLVLASLFQDKPDKRFEKVRDKIAANRSKNVRVLSKALDAVISRDQEAFAAAIEACVKHHMTKPKPDPAAYFMEDWLPLHANTIYLAGLALGLHRPNYPPEVAAYLMTPESVGF